MTAAPTGAQEITLADGRHDLVIEEAPLVLEIDGTTLLTMRTPQGEQHDLDWAVGFLASESVIADVSEIRSMQWSQMSEAASARVEVKLWRSAVPEQLGTLARTHEIRPSCGLCGATDASSLLAGVQSLPPETPRLPIGRLEALLARLRGQQVLFEATGGCHGCAILDVAGDPHALREDIGRHNALDAAIGACLRKGVRLRDSVAVLSGRAGYELVIKAVRVGIPIILSVGAASTLSVEIASRAGATLVGFARGHGDSFRCNIYADSGRIVA